ncbi:pyrD, dihydroorotate dehydrogenase (fumarate) [Nostoc sphaeroides CCNUC1]|uniref:PyrD, dihydroorotate dehydrogenase (Fumarate) n=1 Tax=Nostoc sphaeroides CCNUC1 TaxID=2653204 RepID=A0A5P8WFY2_9NOSO|nr:pyrD, dihydroorotate dehydrogenase (fumarate) [Nostoc sphaeroides CCNUC1]
MDLTTTYLGMKLRSPLVPSASPLSEDIDNIRRMEDAGAAAVVMHSLFEEQLDLERYELHHHLTQGSESFSEALTYFPDSINFRVGPENYFMFHE